MKLRKHLMNFLIIALFTSLVSCQQDKYPNLEDGLYAEFVTTKGTMVAKLHYDKVPVTVANFVALAEGTHPNVTDSLKGKKYYNGLTFHRVMDKFMIQGGDPTATGTGGPGYKFDDEFHPDLVHDKPGILSMANSGPAATNGSQFFITEVPYPSLNAFDAVGNLKDCANPRVSCHSVFGELVIGLEVQDSISNVKKDGQNKPLEAVVITELNIIRKGAAAKNFDAAKVYTEELPKIAERKKVLEEEQHKIAEENAKAAKANFISGNKDKGTLKEFPTGIVMVFTKDANGEKPNATQKVLVDYAGFFEDGKLFDTSWADVAKANGTYDEQKDKNNGYKPFEMIYNETARLVPGFREAMLNMKVGDKARVFIPSYLGYGARGAGNVIPPNANIIFDIEIMGIVK